MLKNKRLLWIAFAVVFIAVLILIKVKPEPKKEVALEQNGLSTYSDEAIEDLINKDSDLDGISDWEEGLWGTDPKKNDTDGDGIKDDVEIAQAKEQKKANGEIIAEPENLTETDKFSRELFSTIASLNQSGDIDEGTVDALSNSLSDEIQNSAPRKIYTISQIKIASSDTEQTLQNYATALGGIFDRHRINVSVPDILSESLTSDGDINAVTLNKLDPVIKHIQGIINEMLAMNNVPSSISVLHLQTLNAFERLMENLIDIKKVDSDVLVAMSAISQYQDNDDALKIAIEKLISALNQS